MIHNIGSSRKWYATIPVVLLMFTISIWPIMDMIEVEGETRAALDAAIDPPSFSSPVYVEPGFQLPLEVNVTNQGTSTITFDVEAKILNKSNSYNLVWNDSQTLSDLAASESVIASFPGQAMPSTPGIEWCVNITANLSGDEDWSDNYLNITLVTEENIDVGVEEILPSFSTISPGKVVDFRARLYNEGWTDAAGVNATAKIENNIGQEIFNQTVSVDIAGEEETFAEFPTWTVPADSGSYTVTVYVNATGDTDLSNNIKEAAFDVEGGIDLSVNEIDLYYPYHPKEPISPGTPLEITVWLENKGNVETSSATIVKFVITNSSGGTMLNEEKSISPLGQGQQASETFGPWTPLYKDNYTMSAEVITADDVNPNNDVLSLVVPVKNEWDLNVTRAYTVPDSPQVGSKVKIFATIKNDGNLMTNDTEIECNIRDPDSDVVFTSTYDLDQIDIGTQYDIQFRDLWSPEAIGEHNITIRANIAEDTVPENNILSHMIVIGANIDVGVISMDYPLNEETYEPGEITYFTSTLESQSPLTVSANYKLGLYRMGNRSRHLNVGFENWSNLTVSNGTNNRWNITSAGIGAAEGQKYILLSNDTGLAAGESPLVYLPDTTLPQANSLWLRFQASYDLGDGEGSVEISTNDGGDWLDIYTVMDSTTGWIEKEIDLSSYRGKDIGLRFVIDTASGGPGRYFALDNVSIDYLEEESRYENSTNIQIGSHTTRTVTFNHTVEEEGIYLLSARVTTNSDINPGNDRLSSTFEVVRDFRPKPPVAVISSPVGNGIYYANENVTLNASTSYDEDGSIVSYEWRTKGAVIGSGSLVDHIFTNPGTYTVTLRVRDDEGLEATAEVEIRIREKTVDYGFQFTDTELGVEGRGMGKGPVDVSFLDYPIQYLLERPVVAAYNLSGTGIENITWVRLTLDYGLGNTENIELDELDALYYADKIGAWEHAKIVSNDITGEILVCNISVGFRSLVILGKYLPAGPVAKISFGPDKSTYLVGEEIKFSAGASTGNIERYRWDFDGDGEWDAQAREYTYRFEKPGKYNVILEITDENNQTTRARTNITVKEQEDLSEYIPIIIPLIFLVMLVIIVSLILVHRARKKREEAIDLEVEEEEEEAAPAPAAKGKGKKKGAPSGDKSKRKERASKGKKRKKEAAKKVPPRAPPKAPPKTPAKVPTRAKAGGPAGEVKTNTKKPPLKVPTKVPTRTKAKEPEKVEAEETEKGAEEEVETEEVEAGGREEKIEEEEEEEEEEICQCPDCGEKVPCDYSRCPVCGAEFEDRPKEEHGKEETKGPEIPDEFPFSCPKCGTDIMISTSANDYPVKVVCTKCGAKGSLKNLPKDLIKRWLDRENIEYDESMFQ